MNYSSVIRVELDKYAEQFPEYSFTQILYSVLTTLKVKNKSELYSVTDEDFYSAILKSIDNERETE